jgi:hypothetical protein
MRLSGQILLGLIEPGAPGWELVSEIRGKLLQLESSWRTLKNDISEAEAEAVLKKAFPGDPALKKLFPDAPRVGTAAYYSVIGIDYIMLAC